MGDTSISWTDATWNPVRGCTRVSEGCRNCYAERIAARFSDPGQPYHGLAIRKRRVHVGERDMRKHVVTVDGRKIDDGLVTDPRWTGEVRFVAEHLADPLRWKRPRRIFVNSMSDLFHDKLTNEQIAAVFGVMAAAKQHTYQVLTKRAKRMREWFQWLYNCCSLEDGYTPRDVLHYYAKAALGESWIKYPEIATAAMRSGPWPLPHVWLGTSCENQDAADERIPDLLATPAAVRFLSCEPLLGPIDLTRIGEYRGESLSALDEIVGHVERPSIDWVIIGCESGPGARPCEVDWLRSLRNQCSRARIPLFLKQAEHNAAFDAITAKDGSRRKGGGVIERPYLDGKQHLAFPEARS
jgi:protein gp37